MFKFVIGVAIGYFFKEEIFVLVARTGLFDKPDRFVEK